MYKHAKGHIKLALISELLYQGVPIAAAFECATACVDAGHVPEFWREQLGDEASDAINDDLERMKK